MAAHLERINRVNPKVNAIVAEAYEPQCLALADAADKRSTKKRNWGHSTDFLIAFKDLQPAVGSLSRAVPRFIETRCEPKIQCCRAIAEGRGYPIGKTNTPEFGMGSHTYNKVYGTTVNPFDAHQKCGWFERRCRCRPASGMLPIADGSDTGGSLRNPGNFNNIVGIADVGLSPSAPNPLRFGIAANGPMARTVRDTAFLLSVMAAPDARDPGAFRRILQCFAEP